MSVDQKVLDLFILYYIIILLNTLHYCYYNIQIILLNLRLQFESFFKIESFFKFLPYTHTKKMKPSLAYLPCWPDPPSSLRLWFDSIKDFVFPPSMAYDNQWYSRIRKYFFPGFYSHIKRFLRNLNYAP